MYVINKKWEGISDNSLLLKKFFSVVFKKLNTDGLFLKRLLITLLLILYATYSYSTYLEYQTTKNESFQRTSESLEDIINDIFANYSLLMRYMGTRIAEHKDPNDLEFIKKILESITAKEYNEKRILSSSLFDWISAQDKMVVSLKTGILNPSQTEFFYRDYIPKCKLTPWVLHFSAPDIGKLSRSWIIPVGMGITDNQGNYLGILDTGFNIASLNNVLEKKLHKDTNSFSILDESYNIVIKSSDNLLSDTSTYYKNLLQIVTAFTKQQDLLQRPIKQDNIEYHYYKKMAYYPYIILSGQSINIANKKLFNTVFSLLAELSGVTLVFLIIFYHYQHKYMDKTLVANKAKYQLIQATSKQLKNDIDTIYHESNNLLKYLNDKQKTRFMKAQQIELIAKVKKTAESLKNFSILNVEKSFINISDLIQAVVMIHSHNTFIKNIKVTQELEPNLSPFYANELCLKQILISLISHSIESIPAGGNLKIRAIIENKNDPYNESHPFLKIMLIDDGFGLNDDDMNRISKKFSDKRDNDPNLIQFDFKSILDLIKQYNGHYALECLPIKGKIITLEFPYPKITQKLDA